MTYKRLLSYEPKTDEEINELLEIIKSNECVDPQDSDCECPSCSARHDIVLSCMRKIWSLCKSKKNYYQDAEDLMADGIIAVQETIDNFVSGKQSGSFGYRSYWDAENAIKKSDLRFENVSLIGYAKTFRASVYKYQGDFKRKYGFNPSSRNIATEIVCRKMNQFEHYVTKEDVIKHIDRMERNVIRVFELGFEALSLSDVIAMDDGEISYTNVIGEDDHGYDEVELENQIKAIFSTLTDQEKLIIGHRFGLQVGDHKYEKLQWFEIIDLLDEDINQQKLSETFLHIIAKLRDREYLWTKEEAEKIKEAKPRKYTSKGKHEVWQHKDQIKLEYEMSNVTMKDLAQKYGVSKELIGVILRSLNADTESKRKRNSHSAWYHTDDICALYQSGETIRGLSKAYGCDPNVIRRILKANNIYDPKRKVSHPSRSPVWQYKKVIASLYQQGTTIADLRRQYNCSSTIIINILKDQGVHNPKKRKKNVQNN